MPRLTIELVLESDEYLDVETMFKDVQDELDYLFTQTDLVEDIEEYTITLKEGCLTTHDKDIIRFQGESGQDD